MWHRSGQLHTKMQGVRRQSLEHGIRKCGHADAAAAAGAAAAAAAAAVAGRHAEELLQVRLVHHLRKAQGAASAAGADADIALCLPIMLLPQ